jgi:chromosome segregation ATPase
MTDSALTHDHRDVKSTRVDEAHDMLSSVPSKEENWLAMAGRDPNSKAAQLDRQTNELLAYVQQQNEEIDSRQSELNAKLAQLDNELRAARLASLRGDGEELLQEDPLPSRSIEHDSPPSGPESDEKGTKDSLTEFDEVERIVSEISKHTDGQRAPSGVQNEPVAGRQDEYSAAAVSDTAWDQPFLDGSSRHGGARRQREDLGVSLDIHAMATSLDTDALESEKRLLAERKLELDRRKSVLQRMQDETQAMHRESLEMRLVTEQLWSKLSGKAPTEQLNELLGSLQSRLDDHYATMKTTLRERKNELATLKGCIDDKQNELRDQSRRLQDWVESRHDEIKNLAAQLDAREMLLDRREHRLQDEYAKWEAQRAGYKKQLQGLVQKLSLAGLHEACE